MMARWFTCSASKGHAHEKKLFGNKDLGVEDYVNLTCRGLTLRRKKLTFVDMFSATGVVGSR